MQTSQGRHSIHTHNTQRHRHTCTHTVTHRHTHQHVDKDTHKWIYTHRHTETQTQAHRHRHTQTDRCTHTYSLPHSLAHSLTHSPRKGSTMHWQPPVVSLKGSQWAATIARTQPYSLEVGLPRSAHGRLAGRKREPRVMGERSKSSVSGSEVAASQVFVQRWAGAESGGSSQPEQGACWWDGMSKGVARRRIWDRSGRRSFSVTCSRVKFGTLGLWFPSGCYLFQSPSAV